MRTNKECPNWAYRSGAATGSGGDSLPPVAVALTVEEEEDVEKEVISTDENLVQIEGGSPWCDVIIDCIVDLVSLEQSSQNYINPIKSYF